MYKKKINHKPISAIAVFSDNKIKGYVKFIENTKNNNVCIMGHLSGLYKNYLHGFHIHEAGDLSDKCTSMCAHLNPFHKNHGGPNSKERHVGDLGNIQTNHKGESDFIFYDNMIKLRGYKSNIIGRGLIIHDMTDDCGTGNNSESRITGNAGKRIACAVIGYAKENFID